MGNRGASADQGVRVLGEWLMLMKAAIYAYAQHLFRKNLERMLKAGEKIQVTIILPEGRRWLNVPLMLLLAL